MRGLFINNKKAKDSIYESGMMTYQCLLLSSKYQLDYIEVDINDREIKAGYDFYFFNYHPLAMGWLDTKLLKKNLGFIFTMVLEVAPNDPFVWCSKNDFDAYCVLDPTVKVKNKNVYPFPRPLEKIDFELPAVENNPPVIGSFGFATKGKGFEKVVEAVNKEFDNAIIRINIPYGDFVPNSKEYACSLGELCKQKAKPGIRVEITHQFMSKEELIKWCASNTLNCFMYDRNMPGLSATTDQAIVAERPLAVSENDTFRHITQYLPPYPEWSLKDAINKSVIIVKKMKENWTQQHFADMFEKVIEENRDELNKKKKPGTGLVKLPLLKKTPVYIINHRIKKYNRKLRSIVKRLYKK